MHNHYYTFMALELARQRAEEADRHRLAALARPARSNQVGIVRRYIARAAVAIARAADECSVQGELAVR
jgi:hypothetical protein